MRKHRLFGVVIAILLGTGLLALSPGTPHHAAGTHAGTLLAQEASAIEKVSNNAAEVRVQAFVASVTSVATSDQLIALSSYMQPLPPVAPAPVHVTAKPPKPVISASSSSGVWAALRRCESNGNYADDTGNGYYGAYQFSRGTWASLGLGGLPSQASPAVQDAAAIHLQQRSGWSQWPVCSRRLGL